MKRQKGFTLIEMMIVVVLIGILAAIAIPNYKEQVISTKRNEARIALVEMAQKLERCFAQFGSYNHANCSVAAPTLDDYVISVISRTQTTYSLQAVATGAQLADKSCKTMLFDHSGKQSALNSSDEESEARCWS